MHRHRPVALLILLLASSTQSLKQDVGSVPGNPVANPASVVTISAVRFTVLTSDVVRIEYSTASPSPVFEDRQTMVVWNRDLPVPEFSVTNVSESVTQIATDGFVLQYDSSVKGPLSAQNLNVKLLRERLWMNVTTWTPGMSTEGNLYGTFHTVGCVLF